MAEKGFEVSSNVYVARFVPLKLRRLPPRAKAPLGTRFHRATDSTADLSLLKVEPGPLRALVVQFEIPARCSG
jgi:hypothetical protein